jgi:hypothetical protein
VECYSLLPWYLQIVSLYGHSTLTDDCPDGTCVFPGKKSGTEAIEIVRKECLSFPERRTVRKDMKLSGRNLRDSRYEHYY